MKKFFAIFAFVILTLALSSCSFMSTTYEENLEFTSDKSDTGVYYSALNIEVVSYIYEDDNGSYIECELQIGLRKLNNNTPLLSGDMFAKLEGELSNRLGLILFHIGDFDVPYYESSSNAYTYYCFDVLGSIDSSLIGDDPHYGFFYYGRDYTLIAPAWINSLRTTVYEGMRAFIADNIEDNYTIDPDAVRLRYYFGGVNAEAKDGIWVSKTVLSLDSMLNCLMWEKGEDDFTSFKLSIEKMAPGWYIVPILLGSAVVVILFLVCKNKQVDSSVFRQVTVEDVKDTDVTVNIIDGQISMEEYSSIEENRGTNSMENDNAK